MKRVRIGDVLKDHAERQDDAATRQRLGPTLQPRLVRRDDAGAYVAAPQLFTLLEGAGWIDPTVNRHRMVLFDLNDVDACIERLKTGDFPELPQEKSA